MAESKNRISGEFLISCDWGSSTFRLKLLNRSNRETLGEIKTMDGAIGMFSQWQEANRQQPVSRDVFYIHFLKGALQSLSETVNFPLNHIPVVISGMASSSIGMKELPYSDLPFFTDGRSMIKEWIQSQQLNYKILLLSGVNSADDIMRGEETQLIGLSSLLDLDVKDAERLFIFPGTHSKHISVSDRAMIGFHTYMTGELFEVMSRHSMLRDSLAENTPEQQLSSSGMEAFNEGVFQSGKSPLLNSLFSVRINHLYHRLTKKENLCYLSGLLIGTELRNIPAGLQNNLVLCSSGLFYQLYKAALEQLNLLPNTFLVDPVTMEAAASAGHLAIIENTQ